MSHRTECDGCKVEIVSGDPAATILQVKDIVGSPVIAWDLCGDCTERVTRLLRGFPVPAGVAVMS